MNRTKRLFVMAMAALGGASVNPASAYFVESPASALLATGGDVALDPTALAIQGRSAALGRDGTAAAQHDGAGVAAFYAARAFRPAWIADGQLTPAATAIVARLADADADGLDPAEFALPSLALGARVLTTPEAIAEADVELSAAMARYVRQAYSGRLDPSSVSGMWASMTSRASTSAGPAPTDSMTPSRTTIVAFSSNPIRS